MDFHVAPDVALALERGQGVVALESTLIAHGLPLPTNLETARAAEAAVLETGAAPATIAVVSGSIRVGLGPGEIEELARSGRFVKASRRDLSVAVARGLDMATTVSATLWIARSFGIGVLATGGLGGVHRGAGTSFDISVDLDELARADGALVVCSGVKAILDLPATLEAFEARGICVVGYQTDTLPAFTAVSSGLPLEHRLDTPEQVADLVQAHRSLGLPGAIVLAQPVPAEMAMDERELEEAISSALTKAREEGVSGKAVTPYLLEHVRDETSGQALRANAALIVANAALAGKIAVELEFRR